MPFKGGRQGLPRGRSPSGCASGRGGAQRHPRVVGQRPQRVILTMLSGWADCRARACRPWYEEGTFTLW